MQDKSSIQRGRLSSSQNNGLETAILMLVDSMETVIQQNHEMLQQNYQLIGLLVDSGPEDDHAPERYMDGTPVQ